MKRYSGAEIESPLNGGGAVSYFLGDLDILGLELYSNPDDIEKDLRSPAIKNPVTVKSAHADSEDSPAKTRKEKKLDYIPESEYLEEIMMMPGMEEAEISYLPEFRKPGIHVIARPAAEEFEFTEAA